MQGRSIIYPRGYTVIDYNTYMLVGFSVSLFEPHWYPFLVLVCLLTRLGCALYRHITHIQHMHAVTVKCIPVI